jgi:hypothetical protein
MKRSMCTVAASVLLAVVGTSGPAQAASADDPDDQPLVGWTLSPGQKSLADDPQAIKEKPAMDTLTRLHGLYDDIEEPGLSESQFANLAGKIRAEQARYEQLSGELIEDVLPSPEVLGMSRAQRADPAAVAAVAVPDRHFLPVKHSTQINDYYCGPASTLMALRSMGAGNRSQLDRSHTLSQTHLASATYLATTRAGTWIYNIPTTMKKWAGVSSKVYRGQSRSQLKSLVRRSNGKANRALIFGTHEVKGQTHYNHHYENKTLDHFVMGYGYSERGNRIHFADPVAGRWEAPKKRASISTGRMAGFTALYGTVG